MMDRKLLIGLGIAASALAHLSVLGLVLLSSDIRSLDAMNAEAIAVDLVAADEAPPAPQPEIPPPPPLDKLALAPKDEQAPPPPKPPQPEPPAPAAKAQKPPKAKPQQTAATSPPSPPPQPPAAAPPPPSPPSQPAAAPQVAAPQLSASIPAAVPQQPDITVKYAVMLGLPEGRDLDPAATKPADIAPDEVTAFRRRLKSCAILPPNISTADKVRIVLRVSLAPDGKLSRAPVLIEASASPKGPPLMQSAIAALQACQPYSMLSPAKYDEWKVIDLSVTPQDFGGG